MSRLVLVLVSLVLAAAPASAQVAVTLTQSGYLLNALDEPLDAPAQALTFRLVTAAAPSVGEPVPWTGTCTVAVRGGYYTAVLGGGCGPALTTTELPPGAPRWLEVVVGSVTLEPRLRLDPAPAAVHALDADSLGGVAAASYVRAQAGTPSAQAGNVAVTGTVAASGFSGDGSLLTAVDAHKLGGYTIGDLDARYAAAGAAGFGTGGTCDASHPGITRWSGGLAQICNGASWVSFVTIPPPAPAAISPTSWGVAGGISFTLTGTDFRPPVHVYFGAVEATVGTAAASSITGTVPSASALGAVDVRVVNSDGSQGLMTGAFTYRALLLGEASSVPGLSCRDILANGGSRGDTTYFVNPAGAPGGPFQVYCDMSTGPGGWTLIAALSNLDATNWVGNAPWATTGTIGTLSSIGSGDYKSAVYGRLASTGLLVTTKSRTATSPFDANAGYWRYTESAFNGQQNLMALYNSVAWPTSVCYGGSWSCSGFRAPLTQAGSNGAVTTGGSFGFSIRNYEADSEIGVTMAAYYRDDFLGTIRNCTWGGGFEGGSYSGSDVGGVSDGGGGTFCTALTGGTNQVLLWER